MSLTLTQLASDNFQRANVSPLTTPWALDEKGDSGLQIANDVCEGIETLDFNAQKYNYSGGTPNDQYASLTLAAPLASVANVYLAVRFTDSAQGVGGSGYLFTISGNNATWQVSTPIDGTIMSGSGLTINAGDVFTIAAVGTTIYALHNGTILGSVTDTTYSSGQTALGAYPINEPSDAQISNFAMGIASTGGSGGSGGNSDPPSGGSDGTQVKVIASGSQYGPVGTVVTLATQVANQKITAGEVEAFGTARGDAPLVSSVFADTQAAVLVAAGITPGVDNSGVAPLPVPILMTKTGKTISVDWQIALQRILNGDATLA